MARQVTMTIDFSFLADPAFRARLPLILLLAVLFVFSGLMLAKASLNIADLFDIPRYEFNIAKLYSISFILFLVLFAIAISLSIVYGHGLGLGAALLPLPLLAITSLIFYLVYSEMLWPLLILAASIEAAAVAGSRQEKITFSSAWGASGKALVVLLLLAFVYVAASVNANKEHYFDSLLGSAAELAPQLKQQVGAACGEIILGAMEQQFTEETVSEQLKSTVPRETVRSNLVALCPMIDNLNSTQQDILVDASYNQSTKMALDIISSVKQTIRTTLAPNETTEAAPEELNETAAAQQVAELKTKIFEFPAAKTLYDYFPLLVALLVLSAAYLAKYVIQFIAAIVCVLVVRI